jgi:hypothetical protein
MTFVTFSLMMPSHYEGSGDFPEILCKGRTMVEQGILVLAEGTTRGRETRKVSNAVPPLETPRIRKQEHPLKLYVLLVMGLGDTILHDLLGFHEGMRIALTETELLALLTTWISN